MTNDTARFHLSFNGPEMAERIGLRAILMGATGLAIAAASGVAFAQEGDLPVAPEAITPADDTTEISEERLRRLGIVTVTARRKEESLQEAPVAITALTGKALDDYAINDFMDLSTQVPTMVAGRAASGSSASIFLRGVGSTALSAGFDQSVSFNIDGLPMSRGREISMPQYDIERVEVLKGPQALFYGKNTTGGLVSVVTKDPTDAYEVSGKAGYGFEAKEKYLEGVISGPLFDTLKGRFAFRMSDSEGAFENSAADVYLDPLGMERRRLSENRGFGETASGRLTLVYEPTDIFGLEFKLGASKQEDGGPTDVLERICGAGRTTPATANGVPPSPNADCRINGVSDSSSIPREVAGANYRYARNGDMYADFSSIYSVLTGKLNLDGLDVESITSYYSFLQKDLNNVAGEHYPANFSQKADYEQVSQELRFSTKSDGPFNSTFGLFYSDSEFIFNTDAYIFIVPVDPVRGTHVTFKRDNGFEGTALSAFYEGTYAFTDQWELSAGARWSREERDSYQESLPASSFFAAFFPGGIRLEDSFSDENISPQVSIAYRPSSNLSYYAAYKEGFKTGGFNISQALTPVATVDAGRFDSETAKGFEAGVRSILFGETLSLNATIFNYLYEDLQVQVFDPVTVSLIADNAGELTTQGIEVDFNWVPDSIRGLSVRGAFAYNKVEYDNFIGQCFGGQTIAQGCNQVPVGGVFQSQDYSGRTPPKAPETAGRLGATYAFPIGQFETSLSGDVSYTGKYFFTDTLRPDAVQDAYTKLDLAARISAPDDRWTLSLIGRNLTEEFVVTSANDIPFTGGVGTGTAVGTVADMSAFVENPREVYLELAVRF
jgi:outer membrane receptor protein involved in Fe transport